MVQQLRTECQFPSSYRTPLARAYDVWACPVFTDPRMDMGHWEFREDGVVVAEGNTEARWP